MSRRRHFTPVAAAILGAAVMLPLVAQSSVSNFRGTVDQPRAWSAIAGSDTASVIEMAATLPSGDLAEADTPYCDADPQIARTLAHDFGESLIDGSSFDGNDAQLWASPVMGTWTLVLARSDAVSCIVASGTGFSDSANPDVFYAKAGLAS